MKRGAWVIVLGMCMMGASAFAAASGPGAFVGLEYWSTDSAYKKTKDATTEVAATFGYNGKSEIDPGLGVRLGFLTPAGKMAGTFWGGSVGYVKGPEGTFTLSGGFGTARFENKTQFLRGLLEVRKDFPVSQKVDFRLGAGVGLAWGKMKEELSVTGFSDDSHSKTWVGLTYEAVPCLVFKTEKMNVLIGAAYAGFPKMKEDDNFYEFKWNPWGLRLGLEF